MIPILWLLQSSLAAGAVKRAVDFRWHAPASCPDEAQVIAQLEETIGAPVVREGARLNVIASVRQAADGTHALRLYTVDGMETRQRTDLVMEDCEGLARAAVMIASMTLNAAGPTPETVEEVVLDEAGAPVAAPKPEPKPEPKLKPLPPAKPVARRARPRGALRLAGGMLAGVLPSIGTVLRVTPALLWPRARLELEVSYGPRRRIRFEDPAQAKVSFAAGAVRGCGVPRVGNVEFPLCGGIELGAALGRTEAFEQNASGRTLFAAILLAPAVIYVPHPRVGVGLLVEGAGHLVRPGFYTDDHGFIYQASPVSVRVLAGVEARFP